MPSWLSAMFAFLQGVLGLLLERKGEQAGRAKQASEAIIEEQKHEELARQAGDLGLDPKRTDELRRKYDRASSSK